MDVAVIASARGGLLALCLLIALSPEPGRAGSGLYTGQAPVNSQADDERAEALKTALAQVMVKLSGDAAVLTKPPIAKAVANAARYVQQYQYVQNVVPDAGQSQPRLNLVAQFDRSAIDRLLHDVSLDHSGGDTTQTAAEVQSGSYRVWVSGVNSAEDYAHLIGSLSRNELVRSVRAEQARGDGVQLKLDVSGPLPRLLDSLVTGPVYLLNAAPPVDGMDALLTMQH